MSSKGMWKKQGGKTGRLPLLRTVPVPSLETPQLWIIAGPNGSGKSTLYQNADIEDFGLSVWIINPDLLSQQIAEREKRSIKTANVEALIRIESWLTASVRAYQTVGVETVLSTEKYRPLILEAKKRGFQIRLIYVLLRSVEENIERVRFRVAKGGHNVPKNKIRSRYKRSILQLPWFLREARIAHIYDNSGATPKLVGSKRDGILTIDPDAPKTILDVAKGFEA